MGNFYIEAIENTTITLSKKGSPSAGTAKYGKNNTTPSTAYTYGNTISLNAGDKCYWTITSKTTAFSSSKYLYFTSTGKINAGGDLSSLIGGQSTIPRNYCFAYLFNNCTTLVDASRIVMVNNFSSYTYCYSYMFQDCTSLTTPPELPATTLAKRCYNYMFNGCTALTTPPKLPATTLAEYCYSYMFRGCTALTTPPELPATTLANYCCERMFRGCTALTTPPKLPATTLANYCYNYMFQDCTSLTTPPELPATTLTTYCYFYMFSGCTALKLSETQTGEYTKAYRIPASGTGTMGTDSTTDMFTGTGGTFTGTPSINTTYYLFDSSTPTTKTCVISYNGSTIATTEEESAINITYNGSTIASAISGSKTLLCNGKMMASDVVIGSKTLQCNGKVMATDVVVTVS